MKTIRQRDVERVGRERERERQRKGGGDRQPWGERVRQTEGHEDTKNEKR